MKISTKIILVILTGTVVLLSFCKNHYRRNSSFSHVPESSIRKGEALAEKYCQSCHLLPDPSLLDANTWDDGVLPTMGPWLGIFSHQYRTYPSARQDPDLDSNFYPRQPQLTGAEWQHIIDYYTVTSPDSLPPQTRHQPIASTLSLFEVLKPAQLLIPPAVCYVAIDTTSTNTSLLISDYITNNIYRLNDSLQCMDTVNTGGPVVDIAFLPNRMVALDIGEMNPNNGQFGKVKNILTGSQGKLKTDTVPIIRNLARPVHITAADLDTNGSMDYVVCEFGFMTGCLSWYQDTGKQDFVRHVLRPLPGAMQVVVQDYNKDQLPDLYVLFAQGEEGVFLFTNRGNGRFEQQQVLRLPPSYGSTFFELVDFNKDGYPDIVYTCGDNADYSPVLKPYHGVYIFLNNGNNQFTQHYFFPINGCYKALARDYDKDGDLDIAAISFFADYARQPEESFVYLHNREGKFHPLTFPENISGRWLTMDAGDLNGDGKIDLVLGNFSKAPAIMPAPVDWSKGPAVIVLKNCLNH